MTADKKRQDEETVAGMIELVWQGGSMTEGTAEVRYCYTTGRLLYHMYNMWLSSETMPHRPLPLWTAKNYQYKKADDFRWMKTTFTKLTPYFANCKIKV